MLAVGEDVLKVHRDVFAEVPKPQDVREWWRSSATASMPSPSAMWLGPVSPEGERGGNLGHMPPLMATAIELVGARLAVSAVGRHGKRCRAIGRAAGDLVHAGQSLEGVGQPDNHHAEVHHRCM